MKRLFLALLTFPALLLAAVPSASAISFEEARSAYLAARDSGKEVDKAVDKLDAFLKEHPDDPVVLAYKGSLKTIQGRDAFFPWRKLAYVNQGFDLLDKAVANVARARDHDGRDGRLDVLMTSGSTNAAVPKAFGRRPLAERDFTLVLKSANFEKLAPTYQSTVYAWLAVAAADRSPQEAQKYLASARAADPQVAERIWQKR